MPAVVLRRVLLIVALVVASVFALRMAWEEIATSPAQAQDLYDCADFATQAEAQAQLLPGDPYGLDADSDSVACEALSEGDAPTTSPTATASPTVTATPTATASPPATASPTASASPTPDTVLDSGGPERGPVPLMPGDRCPSEYPVERAGACYR
jgi:hypothetical protein